MAAVLACGKIAALPPAPAAASRACASTARASSPGRSTSSTASRPPPEALAKALDRAEALRLFDLTDLKRVLAHNQGRQALGPLQALLSSLDPHTKYIQNDFEHHLYAVCRACDLPLPRPNQWLHLEGRQIRPDFLWPAHKLVLETDGYETHGTRQAFEADRAKDRLLLRAGYRVIRVTWRQLREQPREVAATIAAALSS